MLDGSLLDRWVINVSIGSLQLVRAQFCDVAGHFDPYGESLA